MLGGLVIYPVLNLKRKLSKESFSGLNIWHYLDSQESSGSDDDDI